MENELFYTSMIHLVLTYLLVEILRPLRFWKGFLWAFQAANFGSQWLVGDGRKVKFWEDR
jgi:hypothetical protein